MLDNAPPPATRDRVPARSAVHRYLEAAFGWTVEAYGFVEVATPMFERADLFTARSGPEIKNSLLTFHCDHEEYALRPEATAPVCRMVASGALDGEPRPYKLFYVAPCFRYCRPHSGRYREFTQAGIELLGDSAPSADAEVIAAAYRFLRDIGITGLSVRVGTAGIFRALLPDELTADERATVIGHLDRLVGIVERCVNRDRSFDPLLEEQLRADRRELALLQERNDYSGEYVITDSPADGSGDLFRRLPEEAAATYRHLWNVEGYLPEGTGELLVRVSRLRGALSEVSSLAAETLAETRAGPALENLIAVCRLLEHYGIGDFEVTLGIARGLTFYSGTVFEIARGSTKLCGGGRYDRLVELFGGEPTPATGCAVRFDTLETLAGPGSSRASRIGIYLEAASARDEGDAVRLAEALRDHGVSVGAAGASRARVSGGTVLLPDGTEVKAEASIVAQALSRAG